MEITPAHASCLVSGKRGPSPDLLPTVAGVLGVPLSVLVVNDPIEKQYPNRAAACAFAQGELPASAIEIVAEMRLPADVPDPPRRWWYEEICRRAEWLPPRRNL